MPTQTALRPEDIFTPPITIQRVRAGAVVPHYATAQAAGADLSACIEKDIILDPSQRILIPTGLALAIPAGYEGQVRPRSGLALKNGITVLNSPGTIDADYRGEVQVILANLSDKPFTINPGLRIAQLIIAPVVQAVFKEVTMLDTTSRGTGGFGSTGA